jgi:adenylate cyclase
VRRRRAHLARTGIAALAAVIGLLGVLRAPAFVAPIEARILDWHAKVRGPLAPPADVTVVAIDEPSLQRVGHWPWPRAVTAGIVERLAAGGARVVALDLMMPEPDQNASLGLARALAAEYRRRGLDRAGDRSAGFARLLDEAVAASDTDRLLTEALAAAGRVLVPYAFALSEPAPPPLDDDARRRMNRSALIGLAEREALRAIDPVRAIGVQLPLAPFHEAALGAGHVNVVPDPDGALRRSALVVRLGDALYPSLMLEAARVARGLRRTEVRLTADQRIQLGARGMPVDETGSMLLTYYGPRRTFRHLSAADVLLADDPPAVAGHVVLVGFTALGLMDERPTPFDTQMPGVESHATALANLLEGRSLWRHASLRVVEALAVVLLAMGPPLCLPRIGARWGTAFALGLAAVVAGAAHVAFRLGTWLELLPSLAALGIAHVGTVTYQVLTEERERRWIKRAFQQYVPEAVVEAVARDPGALAFGGERRAMTVMFSDIRAYTTFAERHPPEEVVAVLHEYLTAMVEVVFRHGGTLDKFIGDAIMVLFGAPLPDEDHALSACRAAIEMSETLERLNARWQAAGREPLSAGIGISSGEMVVGNLGSAQRFAYTVTGDQVNLAARLEGLTKDYKTRRDIIISEGTYAAVRGRVVVAPLGSVTVKGKVRAVEIYGLVDMAAPGDAAGA